MAKIVTPSQIKVNVATAQALQAGANPKDLEIARQYLGSSKFIGYCQSFVRQVTGGRTQGASAIQAWNNAPQKVQGSINGMQPGDLVYFSPNASNRGYGHTGIYAGQGQFVSATDKGIRQAPIMDWVRATGQKLLGYVPHSDRALEFGGQQGSQSSPQTFTPPTPQQAITHVAQMRQSGMQSQLPIPMPPTPNMQNQNSGIELDPNKLSQGQYA